MTTHTDSLSEKQLDLPVSFDSDGNMMTLKQCLNNRGKALPLASLSSNQLAELTAFRIGSQPKFGMVMIGAGMVDKERAVHEVQIKSAIGNILIEIEERMINSVLQRARLL